jgi:hypothetical protein
MITRRLVIGGCGSGLVFANAIAQQSPETPHSRAPFGLTWGQSVESVRAMGLTLSDTGTPTDYGTSYTLQIQDLKDTLADIEAIALFFGIQNRLWRIFAASKGMGPDPYGYPGIHRYQELLGTLTERYGKGAETDVRGRFSTSPELYVYYLSNGEAKKFVDFTGDGMNIQLDLRGQSGGITRWVLFYESVQEGKAFIKDKATREKNVL